MPFALFEDFNGRGGGIAVAEERQQQATVFISHRLPTFRRRLISLLSKHPSIFGRALSSNARFRVKLQLLEGPVQINRIWLRGSWNGRWPTVSLGAVHFTLETSVVSVWRMDSSVA